MTADNPIRLTLADDGTMDRVFVAECRRCGASWDERLTNDGSGFMSRPDVREAAADMHSEESPRCFPLDTGTTLP